ncbi:MAG TPA: hypothetical protein VFP98_03970, partial [Candidatus Polarisedimenticolia bacterium]|nr:hypothetical protein [Candidatus Polarisedimenticolia bacterium]
GLRRTDRSDTYAGYYDSMGTAGFAATEFAATEKLRFGLDLSRRLTEYEHATIDSDPAAPRRRGAVARAAGRAERDLSEHFTLILEAGRDRAADRDPVYRYERGWIQAGARFRL